MKKVLSGCQTPHPFRHISAELRDLNRSRQSFRDGQAAVLEDAPIRTGAGLDQDHMPRPVINT